MPLPELIEIVPLTSPVRAEITVPGSKSITNRALILAALAGGRTTLRGALWSEDTQVMVDCLQRLGFTVRVDPDPAEACNRTITVDGLGGRIPNAGTADRPLELFVGNAGTAARFLAAMVCLGGGAYRLSGVPRMHERPQAALFVALRELGYRVDSPNDKLPAVVHGEGKRQKAKGESVCSVSVEESSQFASALLLAAGVGGWRVEVTGANEDEMPYVLTTKWLLQEFRVGQFDIEMDASSASYFSGADWLFPIQGKPTIRSVGFNVGPLQVDSRFTNYFQRPPHIHTITAEMGVVPCTISRSTDLGDSIMTAIVLAPFAVLPVCFTDLGRLRVQECERVVALRTELTKCGAKVIEEGDTLTVFPSALHGAEIETYHDHRMAMCFAVLGLKVSGIKIKDPACVKKTFPNFFQKLAAPPPHGLGVTILDGHTGRPLGLDELFAD